MNILVTGSNGFIGKNLKLFLLEKKFNVLEFKRGDSFIKLEKLIEKSDLIFHLAGENRSENNQDFVNNNHLLTKLICQRLSEEKKNIPVIFSSSVQARNSGIYGETKKLAEEELIKLQKDNHNNQWLYGRKFYWFTFWLKKYFYWFKRFEFNRRFIKKD